MIKLLVAKLVFRNSPREGLYPLNSFTVDEGILEKAIKKAVDQMDRNSSALRENLIQSGMSDFEVTRVIAFLPEVCQRVVFKETSHSFSDEYTFICLNSKRQLKGNLSKDAIFLECFRIVDKSFKFFYIKKKLGRIAAMSASNQLIRMALENGSKIENVYFAPIMVMFDQIPSELLEKQ